MGLGQRQIVILIVTALVAAGIATAATLLLTDNNNNEAVATLAPPTFTPLPSESPSPSPTASATPTASPSASASPSAPGTASPTSVPTAKPSNRSASSVDCQKEGDFCSPLNGAKITNDKYTAVNEPGHTYSGIPTISISTTPWKGNKTTAGPADDVAFLHVVVTVENKTSKTFTFPKREIVLEVYKNGKLYNTLSTTGDGFDMTPNGKMTGDFQQPISEDGDYSLQAKVWYYQK